MLEWRKLNKIYNGKPVLKDFSGKLEDGKHYFLLGASGIGKTTFLHSLLGLVKPDSGSIIYPPGTRFSMVFQEDRLIDSFTAVRNVCLVSPKKEKDAKALLLNLGLTEEDLKKPVCEYSGGMKRRVAIARALLVSFDILLLDEPFKGLDTKTRDQVKEIIDQRCKGKISVLVSHQLEDLGKRELMRME